MNLDTRALTDLEPKVLAGDPISRDDVRRLLAAPDLVAVGLLAEAARRAHHGDRVTYGRVLVVSGEDVPADRGAAGEVRIAGRPASIDAARARVRALAAVAAGVPLTGFSMADLLDLVGADHLALAEAAAALAADGLVAVAETPLDRLGDTENAIEVLRAVLHGGLAAWRATVDRATPDDPAAALEIVERAAAIQAETSAFRALAPLPRLANSETPSTGYDDVRTIAVARLRCRSIPSIQVDWPLYGPKLAQVALAFGANDLDGIAPTDASDLGPRRAPIADIERQIRAASGEPCERDGRYETRS
jgi:aminodeoxyfutalosine synthase